MENYVLKRHNGKFIGSFNGAMGRKYSLLPSVIIQVLRNGIGIGIS